MYIRRIDGGWEVLAPAKLNLFFEVLARRADGFHEIESLMVPISLCDTLYCQANPSDAVTLTCNWAEGLLAGHHFTGDDGSSLFEELPSDQRNLALRAALLLRERAASTQGAKLQLIKRIPSAAGLGGGSSDAAAVLVACNKLWQLGWSTEQLATLGAELGSDVPFFLYRSAAVCRGRGERVEPIVGLKTWHLVVVRPPAGLSTATVYDKCRPAEKPAQVEPLIEKLRMGAVPGLNPLLVNRLTEPATQLSPWVDRLLKEFAGSNCWAWGMSGSGTSCYGICPSAKVARRLARQMRDRGLGYAVAAQSIDNAAISSATG